MAATLAGVRIAFVGAGNMAEAMVRGLVAAQAVAAADVACADPSETRRDLFASLGCRAFEENAEAVRGAALVVLAVKPQQMDAALASIAPALGEKACILSIAAGVPTGRIESKLAGARVVRAMPNTPLLVGRGAVALAAGATANDEDLALARAVFEPACLVVLEVEERHLDAVTAVSGSGPAYFFRLVEAMAEAGEAEGLARADALALAAATLAGSAELLAGSGEPPEALRRRVTSPGGTTQAAMESFDASGAYAALVAAVRRAAARSRELARR